MRAGKLDSRIDILRSVLGRSTKGEVTREGLDLVGTVWAGERTMKAVERYAGQQEIAEADIVFEMRDWMGPQTFGPEDRYTLREHGTIAPLYAVQGIVNIVGRHRGFFVLAKYRAELSPAVTPPLPVDEP
jgi:hypothetical protein